MRLSDWERKGSHGHISSLGSSQHQQQTKAAFPSPVHQTDRTRERAPTCHHRQMPLHLQEDGHCFREEGPTQSCVPQSLDENYAENRKPVELVPPSGTESKWCLCYQQLTLLSSPIPLLSLTPSSPPFCPQMAPTNSFSPGSCPQSFAKAAVKTGFKITSDSTPQFLLAQIRSVNLFCQINERSRLLSCCKTIRLGLPCWHLAGCRQGTGRVGRH